MKRKQLFFILAIMPAVTFATIIGEDSTRSTVLVQPDDLGTAAYSNATDFATASQGALAVSAVQPEDLGTMAYAEANDYYTSAEADLRYVWISSDSYPWYGVSWTTNQSVPDLTRIGNLGMHKTLPVQEQMYACVINDAGETVYILDGEDWSKTDFGYPANLDGTDGQVMIHIPEFYFNAVTNASEVSWRISAEPLVGFEKSPEMFVGAFEASVYREDGVTTNLCSVINTDTTYRGGNNNATWDGTESTLLGKAATALTRTQFRTYARARGEGWEMYNYLAHRAITILFTVEYATRNSQKAVNTALSANGYKQGGLGAGVTTVGSAALVAFNTQNPFVPIGTALSIASGTGEVEYTLPAAFSNTVASVKVPVYRGIENPFGHIWKICDGINAQIFADGEPDPSSYAWISNDPDTWNDSNYTGYLNIGKIPRTSGYAVSMLLGHVLPSSVGGSSDTYWCDNFYTSSPTPSGVSLRMALFGGPATVESNAGLCFSRFVLTPVGLAENIGTRLCYLKN